MVVKNTNDYLLYICVCLKCYYMLKHSNVSAKQQYYSGEIKIPLVNLQQLYSKEVKTPLVQLP